MKKGLLIAGGVILSFAVGLVGMYLAMPTVAPDVVAKTQQADSLARDTTARDQRVATSTHASASVAMGARVDSGGTPADSMPSVDSTLSARAPAPRQLVQVWKDSVAALHAKLAALQKDTSRRQLETDKLKERLAVLEDRQARATELSNTLTKLEVRELTPIIKQLDMDVLEHLYAQASGRNKTRLLKALPADYAARFVNRLVDSTPTQRAATVQ